MIYKSKYIECIYQEDASDYLIVTFSTAGMRANGKTFWGDTFLKKKRVAALGFVGVTGNWFPQESMEELVDEVMPILKRYKHICTYGGSMGAYGAIKYSRLLGAKTVVAYSPQYSIDPEQESTAYQKNFEKDLHQNMTIRAEDVSGEIYLFFDPHHLVDAYAAQYIAPLGAVHLIPVPYVGHTTVTHIALAKKGMEVLEYCMAGQIEEVREISKYARRDNPERPFRLAHLSVAKHPKRALAICQKYPGAFKKKDRAFIINCIKNVKHLPVALAWAQEQVLRQPQRASAREWLALCLKAEGDFINAKKALFEAITLEPNNAYYMLVLSDLCQEAKEPDEAIYWAGKAVEVSIHKYPADQEAFRQLILFLRKNGFPAAALQAVRQLLLNCREETAGIVLKRLDNLVAAPQRQLHQGSSGKKA